MRTKNLAWLLLTLASCLLVAAPALADDPPAQGKDASVQRFAGEHPPLWHVVGTEPYLIGGYGDNFSYDGSRVAPMLGKATVLVDADKNAGAQIVKLMGTITPEKGKTYSGKIEIFYTIAQGGPAFREGGVADFIYLHGDTKQGPPVMPKTKIFLGSWGKADVYVNGALVYQGLDGHMMFSERSRDPNTQGVYNKDRSAFYTPMKPTDASIYDPNGRELHFVAHSMKEDKGNFPPHTVWIHVNFQNAVDISGTGGGRGYGGCGRGHGAGGGRCNMPGGTCVGPCNCGGKTGGACNTRDVKCISGCGRQGASASAQKNKSFVN